jgi:predicted ferric reductase
LYIGIIWATIGGIFLIWGIARKSMRPSRKFVGSSLFSYTKLETKANECCCEEEERPLPVSGTKRIYKAIIAESRKILLPDGSHRIFGRVSRLQIILLAILAGYLLIWSFLGFSWKTYKTPVKNKPNLHNTRTTLGPWSDRIGVLAYGMLPLSILLSSRENLLSVITGIPYHHFNFLHRWLGYIILIQSLMHTIGWTIIEAKLYQPQPSVAQEWIKQTYMIWGCVAMILLTIMWVLTWPSIIKKTGYEFFRKVHYVIALIFLGACWGHWEHLKCFLIPSFIFWGIDRSARLVRMFLLHYSLITKEDGTTMAGFQISKASTQMFGDAIIRLDFDQQQTNPWHIGQHFFLTFPQSSIWQAHPLTPLSFPSLSEEGLARHSYLFRAKGGETKKIADLVQQEHSSLDVILTGAYGSSILESVGEQDNILCIAGGTGITFVLPVLLHYARIGSKGQVSLLWVVRNAKDEEWVKPELEQVRSGGIEVTIRSTRDDEQTSKRPDLQEVVQSFLATCNGASSVIASGPGEMLTELRSVVASSNSGKRIMRGESEANVRFISDNRMEW